MKCHNIRDIILNMKKWMRGSKKKNIEVYTDEELEKIEKSEEED